MAAFQVNAGQLRAAGRLDLQAKRPLDFHNTPCRMPHFDRAVIGVQHQHVLGGRFGLRVALAIEVVRLNDMITRVENVAAITGHGPPDFRSLKNGSNRSE